MDQGERNRRIGRRIREAREAKGWSQYALADELDTKAATVSRWENGSFPKRIGLNKVAAALDKPVEWFQESSQPNLDALTARLEALEKAHSGPKFEDISVEEQLLEIFRSADPILQETILKYARAIARGRNGKPSSARRKGG